MNERVFNLYKCELSELGTRCNNTFRFIAIEYKCSFPGIDPAAMAAALANDGFKIVFDDSSISAAENKKKEKRFNALCTIWNNLQAGKIYGKMFTKCRFPFFNAMLYKTTGGFIGWHNFGSSAEQNTIFDLAWTIETIFDTTPEKFVKLYECRDNDL